MRKKYYDQESFFITKELAGLLKLSAKEFTKNNNITTKVIEIKKKIGSNLKIGKCIYISETNHEQLTLGLTIPEIKKAAETTNTAEKIKIIFRGHYA